MIASNGSRADLHIHSKYSDRPSEWFLRRIGAPESFVEPLELYRTCKSRGMQFVTISDHNRIEGALDIAHLPDTFISVESTVYFPEDRCKIHCLVSGITEAQFEEIQRLRENIYDFRDYLVSEKIVHSVAHPLFRVNEKLTVERLEQLLVLFKRFEVINGARDRRANDLMNAVLDNLTPALLEDLANKHNIDPLNERPWVKFRTAGSDDHGGLFSACAYTETPRVECVDQYLESLRQGNHSACGNSGSSLQLGSSLYQIAYSYYRHHFESRPGDKRLIGSLFAGIVSPNSAREQGSWGGVKGLVAKYRRRLLSPAERQLLDDLTSIIYEPAAGSSNAPTDDTPANAVEEQFEKISRVSQHLTRIGFERFLSQVKDGYLVESFQALASLGLVGISITPYITAFQTQHKDEGFVRSVAGHFQGVERYIQKSGRRVWLTDTINDTNGVAHTIKTLSTLASRAGQEIDVLSSVKNPPIVPFTLKNFQPAGVFPLPEYENQEIVLPPLLEMLKYIEQQRFDEIIVSTPGPVGLTGKIIGSILGIKVTGIYHTDFPRYVESLTGDPMMENIAGKFMGWFYRDLDRVLVPSKFYKEDLRQRGLQADKIAILPRGVDRTLFNPKHRCLEFWTPYGLNGEFKYLYVGRVSREKNLDVMFQAFFELSSKEENAALIVVGEGPDWEYYRKNYSHEHIVFTGHLEGEKLAAAYASCDAFVFPSVTDTFGNVVLEAHACGLPAIVSGRGGPQEIVNSFGSGLVLENLESAPLAKAMSRLRKDVGLYQELQFGALKKAEESSWDEVLALL